jgi:hypothetical protein
MSTNFTNYGANIEAFSFFLVAPEPAQDTVIPLDEFATYDEEGNITGHKTIRELCASSNRQVVEHNGYFIFGLNINELHNEHKTVKEALNNNGYALGGFDFSNPSETAYWLFSDVSDIDAWKDARVVAEEEVI